MKKKGSPPTCLSPQVAFRCLPQVAPCASPQVAVRVWPQVAALEEEGREHPHCRWGRWRPPRPPPPSAGCVENPCQPTG